MPRTKFDPTKWNEHKQMAKREFDELMANATPEQKQMVELVAHWWDRWFNHHETPTGHKRLAQILFTTID